MEQSRGNSACGRRDDDTPCLTNAGCTAVTGDNELLVYGAASMNDSVKAVHSPIEHLHPALLVVAVLCVRPVNHSSAIRSGHVALMQAMLAAACTWPHLCKVVLAQEGILGCSKQHLLGRQHAMPSVIVVQPPEHQCAGTHEYKCAIAWRHMQPQLYETCASTLWQPQTLSFVPTTEQLTCARSGMCSSLMCACRSSSSVTALLYMDCIMLNLCRSAMADDSAGSWSAPPCSLPPPLLCRTARSTLEQGNRSP